MNQRLQTFGVTFLLCCIACFGCNQPSTELQQIQRERNQPSTELQQIQRELDTVYDSHMNVDVFNLAVRNNEHATALREYDTHIKRLEHLLMLCDRANDISKGKPLETSDGIKRLSWKVQHACIQNLLADGYFKRARLRSLGGEELNSFDSDIQKACWHSEAAAADNDFWRANHDKRMAEIKQFVYEH